ncbi:MAG: response regulator transcription factor [Lachnospiraceae bacterium]|nr:response regulator transcription factor [Clostridium sp.]MDY4820456.1 response regulator transcription factor [Lachnospiraceae bacterium]
MNILMVEDDEDLSNVVVSQLQKEGYITDVCVNGNDVALFLENGEYDLVLLDRMLPGKDGIQVLKELRSRENTIPVIFITALGEIEDRIEGLDAGADDYLTKPYDIEELKARIRAIARRPLKMEDNHEFAIGSTILDMSRYILRNGEKEISLSKREALLCLLLFRNIGQVLEREKILRKVWGMDNFVEESNVDTYIHFVRRRLKEVESPLVIKSIHGVGYCLVKP